MPEIVKYQISVISYILKLVENYSSQIKTLLPIFLFFWITIVSVPLQGRFYHIYEIAFSHPLHWKKMWSHRFCVTLCEFFSATSNVVLQKILRVTSSINQYTCKHSVVLLNMKDCIYPVRSEFSKLKPTRFSWDSRK